MKPTRIAKKLAELKSRGEKAFVPFITAGDPSLKKTAELIDALEAAGASIIELGVPFSDPMADGPVIQHSSERALAQGVTLFDILGLVRVVRMRTQIPIVLMGYYNPVLQYGLEKFAQEACDAGVDGLLIVDLPAEEAGPLRAAIGEKPIDIIYLLAPTSDDRRLKLVNQYGSGFVYYVSLTGITGAAHLDVSSVAKHLKVLRKKIELPVLVGFGISTPEQVADLAPHGDGVIVGSALIKRIEAKGADDGLAQDIQQFAEQLRNALPRVSA